MQFRNSPETYGAVTKTFHWLTSVTVICLLAVGLYMTSAEKSTTTLQLFNLHKSFGITVLTLTILRVLWHVYSRKPPLVSSLQKWEKMAATAGHLFLYFCLFAMPLSGWVMSSAKGRSVKVFGLGPLPDLVQPDKALGHTLEDVHSFIAWALMGMIALHVAGAIKHHFFDHDITLKRMLPFGMKAEEKKP